MICAVLRGAKKRLTVSMCLLNFWPNSAQGGNALPNVPKILTLPKLV